MVPAPSPSPRRASTASGSWSSSGVATAPGRPASPRSPQDEDLPRAYLEQLVTSLRDAGLVTSTRGARGGYELGAAPDQIRMSDVLRALEGPIAPMICASDAEEHQACDRSARCTVNVLWVRVRDAITSTLDSMTLADLVPVRHLTVDPLRTPSRGAVAAGEAIDAIPEPTLSGASS